MNLISTITLTPVVEQWRQNDPKLYEAMISKIPLRCLGDPEQDIGKEAVILSEQ
ncbi:hypothetical protein [Domibacillus mangrovi]|uniref:hypothetical protein n=1 Tax=Domibacillus mangrovi TaxID=1714354 RepID=UPI000ABBFAE7|nr:hypothetical protein [Domibacillus mangrovi]